MIVIDVPANDGITITHDDTFVFASFKVTRVDFAVEASVTEHPVERGSEVSDHVQVRPPRISVDILVTASPVGRPKPRAIEEARAFLEGASGKRCTLDILGEGVFSDYVLESVRHAKTAVGARAFSLSFRNLRIADAVSVTIPPSAPAPVAAAGAPDEQDLGAQSTTAVPDTSAARALADLLGGMLF